MNEDKDLLEAQEAIEAALGRDFLDYIDKQTLAGNIEVEVDEDAKVIELKYYLNGNSYFCNIELYYDVKEMSLGLDYRVNDIYEFPEGLQVLAEIFKLLEVQGYSKIEGRDDIDFYDYLIWEDYLADELWLFRKVLYNKNVNNNTERKGVLIYE